MLVRYEEIDDAATERQLGADHREIDGFSGRYGKQVRGVALICGNATRDLRDSWVARNAHQVGHRAFA
jgi:hypothetical protein